MKFKNNNHQVNSNNNNYNRNNNQRRPQGNNRVPRVKNPDPMTTPIMRGWEGMKIMRQIARRKFNLYNNGDVFRNLDFVHDTIIEAQKELNIANYHYNAMMMCYGNANDPAIRSIIETDGQKIYAYNLIITQLNEIIRLRDTSPLQVLINQLPQYRKVL